MGQTKYHTYRVTGLSDSTGKEVTTRYTSVSPQKGGGEKVMQRAREQGIHPTECVCLGPTEDLLREEITRR